MHGKYFQINGKCFWNIQEKCLKTKLIRILSLVQINYCKCCVFIVRQFHIFHLPIVVYQNISDSVHSVAILSELSHEFYTVVELSFCFLSYIVQMWGRQAILLTCMHKVYDGLFFQKLGVFFSIFVYYYYHLIEPTIVV